LDAQTNGNVVPIRRSRDAHVAQQAATVTTGRQLFISGDARSAWSRRFHDLSDLGGADLLSEAQFWLIRRAAALRA
jgi:hypothetical protein